VNSNKPLDSTYVNAAATGAVSLNLTNTIFNLTLSGNTTLSYTGAPTLSSSTYSMVVKVTQPGTAYSLTWFANITWLTSGGTAPAAPAVSKTIEYVLTTTDGTNWVGRKGAAT